MKANKFFNYFKANYSQDQAEILYKASALVIINLSGILLLVAASAMNLISAVTNNMNLVNFISGGLDVLMGLMLGMSLIFLRKGKFKTASNLMVATTILLGISIPAIKLETSPVLYNATFLLYLIPAVFAAAFLGYTSWQAFTVWAAAFITFIAVTATRTIPETKAVGAAISAPLIRGIMDFIIFSVASLFSWQIIRTNKNIFSHLHDAEQETQEKMGKMRSLLFSVSEGLDNSKDLNSMSGKSLELSTKISERLSAMTTEMESLLSQVTHSKDIYTNIEEAEKIVKNEMINQSAAVEQSSAAIEAMTESISSMSKIAKEKQNIANQINNARESASEKMKQSTQSVKTIKNSAEQMLNVVKVITDIANKTNLLAMNASIEAAHAGESGKGFAVVANEIRKLAEEATKNSKVIKEIIKKNDTEVEHTVSINQEVVDHFSSISMLITGISTAFQNISNGLAEINNGTSEIHRMVYNLRSLDTRVNEAVDETLQKVFDGNKSIEAISDSSIEIQKGIEGITSDSVVIKDEADIIVSIGEKNIHLIEDLQNNLQDTGNHPAAY
jgi:methyl-accepting chemotaxis protein